MTPDPGELLVGAYLQLVEKCDFVSYNVRPGGAGLDGMGELDVVALRLRDRTAFICEVATHLDGLLYGSGNESTLDVIRKKHELQRRYAAERLGEFQALTFMLWSPRIPRGALLSGLKKIEGLGIVANEDYTARIDDLRDLARKTTRDTGNDAFRILQILERLKR